MDPLLVKLLEILSKLFLQKGISAFAGEANQKKIATAYLKARGDYMNQFGEQFGNDPSKNAFFDWEQNQELILRSVIFDKRIANADQLKFKEDGQEDAFNENNREAAEFFLRKFEERLRVDSELYNLLEEGTKRELVKKTHQIVSERLPKHGQHPELPDTAENLPHGSNRFFTGRTILLKDIWNTLKKHKAVALTGQPGVGKTRAALEYARKHFGKGKGKYPYVFWITADTETGITTGLVDIARTLNLPEQDAENQEITLRAVKSWLKRNTRYLLIFDNVENLTTLNSLLPAGCAGHRMLTERNPSAPGDFFPLPVKLLSPDDAVLFLLRRSNPEKTYEALSDAPEDEQEAAKQLAKELRYLPLALDQAGAYIHETPSVGLNDYLGSYQREKGRILRDRRGETSADHPESVTVTFTLAFEKVEQAEENGSEAADLIRLCAFLHPDDIPKEIITEGIPKLKDNDFSSLRP